MAPISRHYPLITHSRGDSILAWRNGVPVSAAQFLADVAALASRLPAGRHMLNFCADRYRFAVGLGAAVVSGKVSLLPPTQAPEMIAQLAQFAADAFCLADNPACSVALPMMFYPPELDAGAQLPAGAGAAARDAVAAPAQPYQVPQIDAQQLIACVFTSGSTGVPQPHAKTWGALVRNVRAEAQLCKLDDERSHAVVGTVPAQHMYGFESTVMMVLQSANALVAGNSFYPADICRTLASVPRPRVLVSTPVHLRSLLASAVEAPAADLLLSATAPLSAELAASAESRFQAPMLEIYGSTETGQIAARATARTDTWELMPGPVLQQNEGATWASGGHVEQPTLLNDILEILPGGRHFRLHGRNADLINIAGKRNSLANLDLQLNAIAGVQDGAFYMPNEETTGHVTRLMAFVVAPSLQAAAVLEELRQKVDPVFLPRPLVFLDSLPRNSTGKLPRQVLKAMAEAGGKKGTP